MNVTLENGRLIVSFLYNEPIVDAIKSLPDRTYNPADHKWSVGFNSSNLTEVFDTLARHLPLIHTDHLNRLESQCRAYLADLASKQPLMPKNEFEGHIKPIIGRVGELVVSAYLRGDISQADQALMLDLLNHISLKDFVKQ